MDGLPNRAIAQCLGLSEGTVKVHIRNIMIKLRVKNRGELPEAFPEGRSSITDFEGLNSSQHVELST
jgi:FixJ family two-component response regulator